MLAAVPTATGADVVVAAQDVTVLRTPAGNPAGSGVSAAGSALAGSPTIGSGSIAGTVGPGSVVVAVTPQQAQALVAGASDGSLWVAVRPRT